MKTEELNKLLDDNLNIDIEVSESDLKCIYECISIWDSMQFIMGTKGDAGVSQRIRLGFGSENKLQLLTTVNSLKKFIQPYFAGSEISSLPQLRDCFIENYSFYEAYGKTYPFTHKELYSLVEKFYRICEKFSIPKPFFYVIENYTVDKVFNNYAITNIVYKETKKIDIYNDGIKQGNNILRLDFVPAFISKPIIDKITSVMREIENGKNMFNL